MPSISRIVPRDEELGKRDDNYRPAKQNNSWIPVRWRRKRILGLIAGAVFLYIFIHNIPTDLGSIDQRMGRPLRPGHNVDGAQFGQNKQPSPPVPVREQAPPPNRKPTNKPPANIPESGSLQPPVGAPPRPDTKGVGSQEADHYYAGPIKFYNLAASLHAIVKTMGHRERNRNVLFAASSLKSAANIIPMACEMAKQDRNFVHLALLGRDALPLEEILEVNGVDTTSCEVYFHDARADYSEYSTDVRAEVAVAGAMNHIQNFMHPQVVIMDDSAVEDVFFIKGMRGKTSELEIPIIEVPRGKYEDFLWLTQLESVSLANWHKPNVDILIHVPPGGSGGLIRLLRSLSAADYSGLHRPRLTIDLPPDIDPFVKDFLRMFEWPPMASTSGLVRRPQHALKLHHRISTSRMSTEASSIRFLESFYPTDMLDNHVLLLSAQAEVSPLFYHYLTYNLLEHHWGSTMNPHKDNLLGMALTMPQTLLDGSTPFEQPQMSAKNAEKYKKYADPDATSADTSPFLWQAPNADAIFIFGTKWTEIHNYVSNRLRAVHEAPPIAKNKKLVSETQPSWMEFMLELMRARSWLTLYPAPTSTGSWVQVHKELYRVPEEYLRSAPETLKDGGLDSPPPESEEPFLLGSETPYLSNKLESPILSHASLRSSLPFNGKLPELPDLPLLAFDGTDHDTWLPFEAQGAIYSSTLRETVGGCTHADAGRPRHIAGGSTDDLFCLSGQERRYIEIPEPEEARTVAVAETKGEVKKVEAVEKTTAKAAAVDDVEEAVELADVPKAGVAGKPAPVVPVPVPVAGAGAGTGAEVEKEKTAPPALKHAAEEIV